MSDENYPASCQEWSNSSETSEDDLRFENCFRQDFDRKTEILNPKRTSETQWYHKVSSEDIGRDKKNRHTDVDSVKTNMIMSWEKNQNIHSNISRIQRNEREVESTYTDVMHASASAYFQHVLIDHLCFSNEALEPIQEHASSVFKTFRDALSVLNEERFTCDAFNEFSDDKYQEEPYVHFRERLHTEDLQIKETGHNLSVCTDFIQASTKAVCQNEPMDISNPDNEASEPIHKDAVNATEKCISPTFDDDLSASGPSNFSCDIRNESSKFKRPLEAHYPNHTRKKPFSCDICKRGCSTNQSLNRHMLTHSGERPHKCNECSKEFIQKHHLESHIRIHTGEKPFTCKNCEKCFGSSVYFRRHIKICGLSYEDRQHECNLCPKKFSEKRHLIIHYRMHTGEKPHKCEKCGKSFSYRGSFRKHIKTCRMS